MSRLVIPAQIWDELRKELFKDANESFAVLIGRSLTENGELKRIVVHELVIPREDQVDVRTPVSVQVSPHFVVALCNRIRKSGETLVFAHSHPFPYNEFSKTDDEGEAKLMEFFSRRAPGSLHASLLLTPETSLARILGTDTYVKVVSVGASLLYNESLTNGTITQNHDRQVRAFGVEGQRVLQSLRVGIIGLGGTGSVVAQQLAYLGVRSYLLLDPDVIEQSNLNRIVGATNVDVGQNKVDIAKKQILTINPEANVEALKDSVIRNRVARLLIDTDVAFCCTDSHGSRAVLNQLAYQYLIPIIDMGVVITSQEGKVDHIAARTQLLSPGLACMTCGNLLDPEEIRRDLLTEYERKIDPYILNDPEPAPAVISLNSTIASMAITMFLNCVTGIPGSARFINYNAMTGVTRPAFCSQHPTCFVCSPSGSFAKADEWTLPGRLD